MTLITRHIRKELMQVSSMRPNTGMLPWHQNSSANTDSGKPKTRQEPKMRCGGQANGKPSRGEWCRNGLNSQTPCSQIMNQFSSMIGIEFRPLEENSSVIGFYLFRQCSQNWLLRVLSCVWRAVTTIFRKDNCIFERIEHKATNSSYYHRDTVIWRCLVNCMV